MTEQQHVVQGHKWFARPAFSLVVAIHCNDMLTHLSSVLSFGSSRWSFLTLNSCMWLVALHSYDAPVKSCYVFCLFRWYSIEWADRTVKNVTLESQGGVTHLKSHASSDGKIWKIWGKTNKRRLLVCIFFDAPQEGASIVAGYNISVIGIYCQFEGTVKTRRG